MWVVAGFVLLALAGLALWGKRWAYAAFIAVGLLWIPARAGFRFERPSCDVSLSLKSAGAALGNWPHIFLFGVFVILTAVQLRGRLARRLAFAWVAAMLFGVLIELQQGATGTGNCEFHDLVPDAAGALFGAALMAAWLRRCH